MREEGGTLIQPRALWFPGTSYKSLLGCPEITWTFSFHISKANSKVRWQVVQIDVPRLGWQEREIQLGKGSHESIGFYLYHISLVLEHVFPGLICGWTSANTRISCKYSRALGAAGGWWAHLDQEKIPCPGFSRNVQTRPAEVQQDTSLADSSSHLPWSRRSREHLKI